MSKFKVGDKVLVSQSPTVGTYDIEDEFPFTTTITSLPDSDDDYMVEKGGWYVKEDMLTLIDEEPDPYANIKYVLNLGLSDAITLAAIRELVGAA